MEIVPIVIIVYGSVAASVLLLCCLCKIGRKEKPPYVSNVAYGDVEKGRDPAATSRGMDGSMVVLGATGAAAALGTTTVFTGCGGGGAGGCGGCGGGGGGGGGDGGGAGGCGGGGGGGGD
ncbi:hypothetical protein OROMI_019983 [Orobanche minor]